MFLLFLLSVPLGILASPIELDIAHLEQHKIQLLNALSHFGQENFTWPELELTPVYQPTVEAEETNAFVTSRHEPLLDPTSKPPARHTHIVKNPVHILHHPSNDDQETDVCYYTEVDTTQPICSFFQHSVLGKDFGESTFPRVSFASSETLPFRVHYAPDDDLRFESYKWPFSACNHACELQALVIRALFDWELDPMNEDSPFDAGTKDTLLTAREICQWKNARRFFAFDDCSGELRKRSVPVPESLFGNITDMSPLGSSKAVFVSDGEQTLSSPEDLTPEALGPTNVNEPPPSKRLYLSETAQLAMQEIWNIFTSTKGPKDLAQMFHTVIVACQIHHYTSTPMKELEASSFDEMVQQAMSQIGHVFAETQGRIDVWEARDAIVRATQIYRYQEERNLLENV